MRLIWWFATVVVIGIFTILLSEANALNPLRSITLTVSAPVENTISDAASPLSDIYEGIVDRGDLVRENESLRAENETLAQQIAEQQANEQRIAELEAALGVKNAHTEFELTVATVFSRDSSALKRVIAINLGKDDGIDEGMVVLSPHGQGSLVGTVMLALDGHSWVRLLNDPDSAVNAQVNGVSVPGGGVLTPDDVENPDASGSPTSVPSETPVPQPVRGVAQGNLGDELVLDLLPPEAPIEAGAIVVTSGLGGNYPPNILIGSITDVEERPQAPFKKALVEPAAKLSALDTVLVITNFTPERLDAP